MARRSKLTKKTIEAICDAISIGATYEIAAGYGRISERLFYMWMDRGRKESERLEGDKDAVPDKNERKYLQFFQDVCNANHDAAITWLNVISNSAAVDPNWSRYLLEQRFPRHYGQKGKSAAVTYNVDVSKLTDEQLIRIAQGEEPDVVFAASSDGGVGDATPLKGDPDDSGDDSGPEPKSGPAQPTTS